MASVMPLLQYTAGENTPGTHSAGGSVGSRVSPDTKESEQNPSPLLGIEPCFPGHSQSLY